MIVQDDAEIKPEAASIYSSMTHGRSRLQRGFDGLESRTTFCLWTGDEQMSENRIRALWTIFSNLGSPVAFVNRGTIDEWVKPEHPLHPSYPFLSSTHKADYLRCYLMHYYGGGYTDVKITTRPWQGFFEALAQSDKLALGYQELAHGIPHVEGPFGDVLRASHKELIGLCAFIFRGQTELTYEWLIRTEMLLDAKLAQLERSPAQHPQDQTGVTLPNGQTSTYPLRWAELLGEIFHPLIYKFRSRLLQAPIEPFFGGYR